MPKTEVDLADIIDSLTKGAVITCIFMLVFSSFLLLDGAVSIAAFIMIIWGAVWGTAFYNALKRKNDGEEG